MTGTAHELLQDTPTEKKKKSEIRQLEVEWVAVVVADLLLKSEMSCEKGKKLRRIVEHRTATAHCNYAAALALKNFSTFCLLQPNLFYLSFQTQVVAHRL